MLKFDLKIDSSALEKSRDDIIEKAKIVLRSSMMKMEELAVQFAPTDRGILRTHISLFPQLLADTYTLTSSAPYSAVMEYGSRPFYAPIKPLKEWAKRQIGDENAGYAVRAKIAKYGIMMHPFMRPALFEVEHFWLPEYRKQMFG